MKGTRAVAALAVLAALALPAHAGASHTLAHKVAALQSSVKKLNAKLACLQKFPVRQFEDYASADIKVDAAVGYGGTDPLFVLVPEVGDLTGLDFNFDFAPATTHAWLLGLKNTSACRKTFATAPNPVPRALRHARLARLR